MAPERLVRRYFPEIPKPIAGTRYSLSEQKGVAERGTYSHLAFLPAREGWVRSGDRSVEPERCEVHSK